MYAEFDQIVVWTYLVSWLFNEDFHATSILPNGMMVTKWPLQYVGGWNLPEDLQTCVWTLLSLTECI